MNKQIEIDYIVVTNHEKIDFENAVKIAMINGYKPTGGVAVESVGNGTLLQAMVKYGKNGAQ